MTHPRHPDLWFDDALQLLTLRLEHEVALTRLLRGDTRQEGFLGLFVSDDEAQAIIAELAGTRSVTGAALNDSQIAAFWAQISAARVADKAGIWARYSAALGLVEAELDLILLAAAPALDPRFGRVYGYLNDDMARRHLTPDLARVLLDRHALSVRDIRAMLAPGAPLLAFGILDAPDTSPFNDTPLRLNERALDELLAGSPAPSTAFEVQPVLELEVTPKTAFAGDAGFGASQIAAAQGQRLMLCDLNQCDDIPAAFRAAALHNALPLFLNADTLEPPRAAAFAKAAAPHALALASDRPDAWGARGLICATPALPTMPLAARLKALDPAVDTHPADLSRALARLRASDKLDLTTLLTLMARHHDSPGIDAALARRMGGDLQQLAQRIDTGFGLDDLVVPRATRRALDTIISWRSHAPAVLDDWGLGATYGKGRALTALFKGPSGTGKTMAASVIAGALDLPLYRVDLATLVSKYIGETERNLDRVFSAAEAADVVLFFDECDAIFGKRSEVNDAHDRHANVETAYLLQRMEQFAGLMILASNLHNNMDEAFLRRIDLVTEFPAPGVRERLALWQRLSLTQAPLGDDLDYDFLAQNFELTGGEIRNCCLDAAHHSCAAGGLLDMSALVQAVARELLKQGRTVHRASFGAWQSALEPKR